MAFYYSKEQLSHRRSLTNLSELQEAEEAQVNISLLMKCCQRLLLPCHTRATSFYLYHRFYQQQNLSDVLVAVLSLAMKFEENVRKLRDIYLAVTYVLTKQDLSTSQIDLALIKERILIMELLMIEDIQFEMRITHPYRFLFPILKEMNASDQVANKAFLIVHDSYSTNACIRYPPQDIAMACIYLSWRIYHGPDIQYLLKKDLLEYYECEFALVKGIFLSSFDPFHLGCITVILNFYIRTGRFEKGIHFESVLQDMSRHEEGHSHQNRQPQNHNSQQSYHHNKKQTHHHHSHRQYHNKSGSRDSYSSNTESYSQHQSSRDSYSQPRDNRRNSFQPHYKKNGKGWF